MKEFKVPPIRNGTVIDHIPAGRAVRVLEVLGIPRAGSSSIVSMAMNVATRNSKERKDIVKIEDRELDSDELSRIAIIAPGATINIIRNYDVAKKEQVALPDMIEGITVCPNTSCITNSEPATTKFRVVSQDPMVIRCHHCNTDLNADDIA